MGETKIGWTDVTWNPTTGCSHVSAGCDHCYAEDLSLRRGWSKKPWTHQDAVENVVLHPKRLDLPLHWRKPRMVFVDSMSDLFHKQVPFNFIAQVFDVMADIRAAEHVFQVLTKRPHRMRKFFEWFGEHWPTESPANLTMEVYGNIPNVWIGVSVEDQRRADERIAVLSDVPAAVRWISAEPLLGPIDFYKAGSLGPEIGDPFSFSALSGTEDSEPSIPGLDWVVVGGESGQHYRPMQLEWIKCIVAQCDAAKVPVFVKQGAGPMPGRQYELPDQLWARKDFPNG